MRILRFILILLLLSGSAWLQAQQKNIVHNTHTWVSINSNLYFHPRWFVMADVHLRENDFFASGSFLFGRLGLGYQLNKHLSVAAGYGYLELYPQQPGAQTGTGEDRIYQQVQLSSKQGTIQLLQRLRLEQRWRQVVLNDRFTGDHQFSQRVRYLLSVTIPVSRNPHFPQLVLADECMLQFGKEIISNTFDQNRLFLGIRQGISQSLSFDAGYMRVFQQTATPGKYNLNDTFRLFFYYTLRRAAKA